MYVYSTLGKVVGVTAFALQFASNIKNKLNRETGPPTAAELHEVGQRLPATGEFTNMLLTHD